MSTISRQLPRSVESVWQAIRVAKQKKDSIPPADNLLREATSNTLDSVFDSMGTMRHNRLLAKEAYTANTPLKNEAIAKLKMFISHFIQHLNDAIARGEIDRSKRVLYNLDENDATVPVMSRAQDVVDWGDNVVQGEADRVAAGGTALSQPSAAQIATLLADAKDKLVVQSKYYTEYNSAQEELQTLLAEVAKFVRQMWAEIESAFAADPDAGSRRAQAEPWGVVYVSVGDKKITVTVRVEDSVTHEPVEGAICEFDKAGFELITNALGQATTTEDYVGPDTLSVEHVDYITQTKAVVFSSDQNLDILIHLVKVE